MAETADELFRRLIDTVVDNGTACHLDGSFVSEIGPVVDEASLDAKSAEQMLTEAFDPNRRRLLDYGCGAAHHRPFIEGLGFDWRGVDFKDSISFLARDAVEALGTNIVFYDGKSLPFADREFDVIYSMLVFHHVRNIDVAFVEMARVLANGGRIIGQVSAMEQMQDFATFNYTPFGLKVACKSAGLRLTKVYPKHDVFSFLVRRLAITLGASDDNAFTAMLDPTGFVHEKLINYGQRYGLSVQYINLLRLKFSMQYVFQISKG